MSYIQSRQFVAFTMPQDFDYSNFIMKTCEYIKENGWKKDDTDERINDLYEFIEFNDDEIDYGDLIGELESVIEYLPETFTMILECDSEYTCNYNSYYVLMDLLIPLMTDNVVVESWSVNDSREGSDSGVNYYLKNGKVYDQDDVIELIEKVV